MVMRILTAQNRSSGGTTDRNAHEKIVETRTSRNQMLLQPRHVPNRAAVQIIGENENNIG